MYQLIDITKWCNTCKHEKTSWNKKGRSKQCDKCQFKDSKPSNHIMKEGEISEYSTTN
jgi:hypothetical protein